MSGNTACISSFLEDMDHEFREYDDIKLVKQGYKVDGDGIKKYCELLNYKSIDYYHFDDKRGFMFVEFSDLLKQDAQIQQFIERIGESDLAKADKTTLRKYYHKLMNKELVEKYKDSYLIKSILGSYLDNIPSFFNDKSFYCIVVAPMNNLELIERMERSRFLDILQAKVAGSLPSATFTDVKIITLDKFC
ncbi:hypothetical protein NRA10_19215 [Acinetobacter baumannii]|uniref:hypothetical protein n=1 Tax=Acinetobacter baumannii TaxID=470 RepID=UPI002342710A|nr:hypothetical protein [Acinetobacter baumannii]MDC5044293.1 hypothetical protein [Acinetobacter baumannii]